MPVFSIAHNVRTPDSILDNHIVTVILSQNKIPRKKSNFMSYLPSPLWIWYLGFGTYFEFEKLCVYIYDRLGILNEKQYAYVAGFQRTIVSKLHKCFFLAQCFNIPQKPAIIAYCMCVPWLANIVLLNKKNTREWKSLMCGLTFRNISKWQGGLEKFKHWSKPYCKGLYWRTETV